VDLGSVKPEDIEANIIRVPRPGVAEKMIELIDSVRKDGDSIGGIIQGVIKNVPAGLGEPVFDKLNSDLGVRCSPSMR